MAMNVPTWGNKGVSPSNERKQEGYLAGQCLPANHLNWFLNQIFTNLEDAKGQLANLTTQSGNNNTYINSIKAELNKLLANMPVRVICGSYTGSLSTSVPTQTINIGATPSVVILLEKNSTDVGVVTKMGAVTNGTGERYYEIVENGFILENGQNRLGTNYYYAAFIEY